MRSRVGLGFDVHPFGDEPPQLLRRATLHPRRYLLGEQLEQQFSHGEAPRPQPNSAAPVVSLSNHNVECASRPSTSSGLGVGSGLRKSV